MILSSLIGGLFLGVLISIFLLLVWGLVKEGVGNPKEIAIPAIILLSIFGLPLVYFTGMVFEHWSLFLGAVISLSYCARALLKPDA